MTRPYDCIVIGSGIGGLTTANLLAKVGRKRVLVLERHFKPGGFTHSFRRHQYHWDVGLHYVGQMQPGALSRRIMDLITGGQVDWQPMSSPYERFVFPEFTYEVPVTAKKFQQQLIADFPDERQRIVRYFRDARATEGWGIRWFAGKQAWPWLANWLTWPGRKLATQATGDYLKRFDNHKLRTILASQWPDMGTPPEFSAFAFHALIATNYFEGAFYPIGGSGQIGKAAVELLEKHGGDCLLNHTAQEIIVENGRASGVRAQTKHGMVEFRAPCIVSDAGVVTTFNQLVPREHGQVERTRVADTRPGPSAVILFLGLKEDPRRSGFDGANYWIFNHQQHVLRPPHRDGLWKPDGVFLTFGSLRDPLAAAHTAQIIAFAYEQEWQSFIDSKWKRRGPDYEDCKLAISEQLIAFVEQRLPGLRSLIDYAELSTPLTVKSFTGHTGGSIYGPLCDQARLSTAQWRCDTSILGLYLTGADVGMPGINGAQMAGVMTAARILGPLGMPRIMLWSAKAKP